MFDRFMWYALWVETIRQFAMNRNKKDGSKVKSSDSSLAFLALVSYDELFVQSFLATCSLASSYVNAILL